MSSGGEGAGAGAGAGGAPGRGSVCVVGHVEGLPGGPRVVPAALVLAQRRQPVHLWGKETSVAPVGYGPQGPPVPGDTAFRVPQLMGTRSQLSPVPLQQHSPWHPPPKGTEPSASHISQGTTLGVPHHPMGCGFWHLSSHRDTALDVPCHLRGHSPSHTERALGIPHSPRGMWSSLSPIPHKDNHQHPSHGDHGP